MARFAFVLPHLPERTGAWRRAALSVPQVCAKAHRKFLIDSSIREEWIWPQPGWGDRATDGPHGDVALAFGVDHGAIKNHRVRARLGPAHDGQLRPLGRRPV